MENRPTCGEGLAEHSVLPASLGELMASMAENLELHMEALDLNDSASRQEYDAYQELANEHREIATRLQAAAKKMAGHRDLPMGPHDPNVMSAPKLVDAFRRFLELEQSLQALLQKMVEQDQKLFN